MPKQVGHHLGTFHLKMAMTFITHTQYFSHETKDTQPFSITRHENNQRPTKQHHSLREMIDMKNHKNLHNTKYRKSPFHIQNVMNAL